MLSEEKIREHKANLELLESKAERLKHMLSIYPKLRKKISLQINEVEFKISELKQILNG